jgi:predicted esterase
LTDILTLPDIPGLHAGQPALLHGAALDQARAAVLMAHGRGADAASILSLADELDRPECAYLAPEARGNTWYPQHFMSPIEQNEPWLSSALGVLGACLAHLQSAGIPAERTVLLGFSQGACLVQEYVARHPRHYGGLIGLSGGLIGPPGTRWEASGSLDNTTVFLGCGDPDPHIPKERVLESTQVFTRLGGQVTARLYPGLGHTVNRDEIDSIRGILVGVISSDIPPATH